MARGDLVRSDSVNGSCLLIVRVVHHQRKLPYYELVGVRVFLVNLAQQLLFLLPTKQ